MRTIFPKVFLRSCAGSNLKRSPKVTNKLPSRANTSREPKWFDAYCPIRNVSREYPPTILVHGTEDTDVPYSESRNMAARLKEAGVEHELITVEGGGHGLGDSAPQVVEDANARAVAFIRARL